MFNIPKASHRATVIFTCFESQDHQGERDRWWWPWEAQISAALTPPVLHHPSSSTQQNSLTAGPVPTSHLSALGPSPSWRWLLSDILPLQLDDVMTEYDGIAALSFPFTLTCQGIMANSCFFISCLVSTTTCWGLASPAPGGFMAHGFSFSYFLVKV